MASAAYARRNAAARLLGYRSYYDYRIHNHGAIPPGERAPGGEARARLRGHRGAADYRASLSAETLVTVQSTDRKADGQLTKVTLLVIYPGGRSRTFVLRGKALKSEQLKALVRDTEAAGAIFSPSPSLDVRRIQDQLDMEMGEAEHHDRLQREGL